MNKQTPEPQAKRVPLGKPLHRPSEKQAEADAVLSPADIENAAQWWRENAPNEFASLLSAKSEGE